MRSKDAQGTASTAILGILTATASAQFRFTLSGTVTSNTSSSDYQVNDTILISFTTTAAGMSEGYADTTYYSWDDLGSDSVPALIQSLSFSGASGTYTRPAEGNLSYFDITADYGGGFPGSTYTIGVDRANGASSGLTVGAHQLTYIYLGGTWSDPSPRLLRAPPSRLILRSSGRKGIAQ